MVKKQTNPAFKVPDYTHCPVELLHMMMISDDDHGAAKYIFGPIGSETRQSRRAEQTPVFGRCQ